MSATFEDGIIINCSALYLNSIGQYPQALLVYDDIIRQQPNNPEVYFHKCNEKHTQFSYHPLQLSNVAAITTKP